MAATGCATQPMPKESSAESTPVLVVTLTGMVRVANSTVFALYESGRFISIADGDVVVSNFFEERLTVEERDRFLQGLPLERFAKLSPSYQASSLESEKPRWTITAWVGHERHAVEYAGHFGCNRPGPNRMSGFTAPSDGSIPNAFTAILDRVCKVLGRGSPWRPKDFQVLWYPLTTDEEFTWPLSWPLDWQRSHPVQHATVNASQRCQGSSTQTS